MTQLRPSRWIARYGLAAFFLLAGVALSGFVAQQTLRAGAREDAEAFRRRANRAHLITSERFARFETLLHGGRGLWIASESVEPREWSQFLSGFHMDGGLNAVRSFGFAAAGRTGHRGEAFHAHVRLAEPAREAQSLLSRDFAAVPSIRREMEATLGDGSLRAVETGALQGLGVRGDLLILLPVFESGRSVRTAEDRWDALVGWVFLTLDLDAALQGIETGTGVHMRAGIAAEDGHRWLQPPLPAAALREEAEPQRLGSVGGRIVIHYGGAQAPSEAAAMGVGIGAMGLILSLSISALVYSLANTRRKATELAEGMTATLRREKQESAKLASIAEQTASPVLFLDPQDRIEWANAAFQSLLTRDAAGRPTVPEGGFRFDQEITIADRTVLLTGTPVVAGDGTPLGTVVVAADITDHVQRERALEAARQDAERASHLKSEFLANMSHEVRTPMNGILGMAQELLDSPLDSDQRDATETLFRSAQSLNWLLNDVLDLSKIDSGQLELARDRFDVRELLEETAAPFASAAAAKGVDFVLDIDLPVRTFAVGDPLRIRQAVGNLLSNAVKFTAQGHVTLSAVMGDGLGLTVSDTGIGIPGECQGWVYEPFRQADASTTRKFGGTGLGLTLVRSITEAMDGSIALQSRPGIGTTFSLWLPLPTKVDPAETPRLVVALPIPLGHHEAPIRRFLAHAKVPVRREGLPLVPNIRGGVVESWILGDVRLRHPLRLADLGSALTRPQTNPATLRVLVVDDNDINRKVAGKLLQRHGCGIEFACDGQEALEALATTPFDLVLMDIQMPVLDGLEATRQWRQRERGPRTPIVALTARAMPGDEQECYDAGMDGYLTKPITPARLAQLLNGREVTSPG